MKSKILLGIYGALTCVGCANYAHFEARLDRAGEYTPRVAVSEHYETNPKLFVEAAPSEFNLDVGKISYDESEFRFLGRIVVDLKGRVEDPILDESGWHPQVYSTAERREKMMQIAISEGQRMDATHLIFGNFSDREYAVTSQSSSLVVPFNGVALSEGAAVSQNVRDESVRFVCYAFRRLEVERTLIQKEAEYVEKNSQKGM